MTVEDRPQDLRPATATGGAVSGPSTCDTPGCGKAGAAPCSYDDRRRRRCGYSFCADHQYIVDGKPYCRRHAAVVQAILANPDERLEFPDLDSRALSLCEWVAADIDADMRSLLSGLQDASAPATVHFQPLRLVLRRTPYSRSWSRVWTLSDHTGVQRKLAIEVSEEHDAAVVALVDGKQVSSSVPPWIADRAAEVSDEAVGRRRAEFRADLVRAMMEAATVAQAAAY